MRLFLIVASILMLPGICLAQDVLLEEEFESGLALWEVLGFGQIVSDPLDPGNHVISFSHTADSGNMWSYPLPVDDSTTYVISFRYLGNADGTDSGGYLWLVDPLYGNVESCPAWGTQPENTMVELVDDGQWHTYQLEFEITDFFDPPSGQLLVTIEDWNGAAGTNPPPNVAGDAFFDDIYVYQHGAVASETMSWGTIKSTYR